MKRGLGVAIVSASVQRMNVEGVTYHWLGGAAHLKIPSISCSDAATYQRWSDIS